MAVFSFFFFLFFFFCLYFFLFFFAFHDFFPLVNSGCHLCPCHCAELWPVKSTCVARAAGIGCPRTLYPGQTVDIWLAWPAPQVWPFTYLISGLEWSQNTSVFQLHSLFLTCLGSLSRLYWETLCALEGDQTKTGMFSWSLKSVTCCLTATVHNTQHCFHHGWQGKWWSWANEA